MQIAIGILLVAEMGKAQIPKLCANTENFRSGKCCPEPSSNAGPCGSNLVPPRGTCSLIRNPYMDNVSESESDPRKNWPFFYFNQTCNCNSNYGGYDCGECAFGYRGPNCDLDIRRRRSTSELTDQEWTTYINQLQRAKSSTESRYKVITSPPIRRNLAAIQTVDIGVYNLFVWFHHYATKDNDGMHIT